MLYKLIFDSDNYLNFYFDNEQITRVIGEISDDTIDKRIDMNGIPRSYKGIINEPLNFNFSAENKASKGMPIPDLVNSEGRLFLSKKAYKVLYPMIKDEGEFLPVTYKNGEGYFFIPLQVAEVDKSVTQKNEWGDIISLGFDESTVKGWYVFRTEFDCYMGLYCQTKVKEAIEKENLTGMYITNDLANIFPEDLARVTKLN